MQIIPKAWGSEHVYFNEPEYCKKHLHVNPGWQCSLHMHPIKKETFSVLTGIVYLEVDGRELKLTPYDNHVTIEPMTPHRFRAIDCHAVIEEISTHHDDSDVIRLEESRQVE